MTVTESNKQAVSGIEPRLSQRTGRPAGDASNIIPFPVARASHQRPERAQSRGLTLPLRQAVRKVKGAVLRFIRSTNRVGAQRKRGSTTAAAAHYPQCYPAPVQDHRGRATRQPISA